ncbi:MAG: vitamin B12 dependent-methionine synthase activation domain-containing protein [Patescibacteria group bacterium]|jgi:cobalamin-dependent methionine synthase I
MLLKNIPIEQIYKLIDRPVLFKTRWQMKDQQLAEYTFSQVWAMSLKQDLWHPQAVYKIMPANSIKQFNFALKINVASKFALQLVTAGSVVKDKTTKLGQAGQVEQQFLLHGLAAEFTEALAVWCNNKIAQIIQAKKTRRLSPGYPIWPSLTEQTKIFALLKPEKIGVTLSDTLQMIPEFSTSAIVLPI